VAEASKDWSQPRTPTLEQSQEVGLEAFYTPFSSGGHFWKRPPKREPLPEQRHNCSGSRGGRCASAGSAPRCLKTFLRWIEECLQWLPRMDSHWSRAALPQGCHVGHVGHACAWDRSTPGLKKRPSVPPPARGVLFGPIGDLPDPHHCWPPLVPRSHWETARSLPRPLIPRSLWHAALL